MRYLPVFLLKTIGFREDVFRRVPRVIASRTVHGVRGTVMVVVHRGGRRRSRMQWRRGVRVSARGRAVLVFRYVLAGGGHQNRFHVLFIFRYVCPASYRMFIYLLRQDNVAGSRGAHQAIRIRPGTRYICRLKYSSPSLPVQHYYSRSFRSGHRLSHAAGRQR